MTPGRGSASPSMRWRRLTRSSCARCCTPAWTTWSPRSTPPRAPRCTPCRCWARPSGPRCCRSGMTPRRRCRPRRCRSCSKRRRPRTPDAVAVVCEDERVTYAELNRRANRLARVLVGGAAGPEPVVAVMMDRSAELVAALLAVVKAGAAYLPVQPGTPPSGRRGCSPTPGCRSCWPTRRPGSALMRCPRVAAAIASRPAGRRRHGPAITRLPDQLAYVMYTSGSTGTPKGVAVRHRDVAGVRGDRCWAAGRAPAGAHARVGRL